VAIVESSDDAILSKDLNGVIMTWNRGAQLLFGYTAEEAVGRSVTILIPTDRHDEEPMILERIRLGQSVDHYETIRQRKDGSLVNISLTSRRSETKRARSSAPRKSPAISRKANGLRSNKSSYFEKWTIASRICSRSQSAF
jgi:PAS domain S-box-containing protein